MPIRTAFWKVGPRPGRPAESSLGNEQLLEAMVVAGSSSECVDGSLGPFALVTKVLICEEAADDRE